MARILQLFPATNGQAAGVVRESESARARVEQAARLRETLLDDSHMAELYGAFAAIDTSVSPGELMPAPDEVRWPGITKIYDEMGANVLWYGAMRETLIDTVTSLPMVWLPGIKGDRESEQAAEEVQAAFEAIEERSIAIRAWCRAFERGFSPVENVWGVHQIGDLDEYVAPVELINRPVSWFGFDYRNQPRFKENHQHFGQEFDLVPEFKVSFMRVGSLHTPHGHGYGQDCYPAVWGIDAAMKGFMQLAERFGYMPIVVTYPNNWRPGSAQYASLFATLKTQWKNVLLMPGEVTEPTYKSVGSEVFTAANASGEARLKYIAEQKEWLGMRIQGSMTSSPNKVGSFAKDQTADAAKLYKAPYYSSCIEATINRGFAKPCVLVNRPLLPRAKWPRVSIDASFGSDLNLRLKIYQTAVAMEFPVAAVTFSEDFKLPMASPGDVVLMKKAVPQNLLAGSMPADPSNVDASADAQEFGEQGIITIHRADGSHVNFMPDAAVYTENRGVVRASMLTRDDLAVVDQDAVRKAS